MKKFNPNKNIIIVLIIVILVVTVISVTAAQRKDDGETNIVQSTVNDVVGFVDGAITAPANWLNSGITAVSDLFTTFDENQRLKEKIDDYGNVAQQNADYERQIAALQEQLNLTSTLTDYETVNSNVISRSPDTWQNTLIVDKGSNDGVEVNMAVMAKSGLAGRVIEVNASSSKVELLTSDNETSNHFPVKISSGDGIAYGLLETYDADRNLLVVTQVTGTSTIAVDDLVQTSGLGGNSPANLSIGKVVEVKNDSNGLDREVFVQPNVDMYDISVVTIIKRSVGEG